MLKRSVKPFAVLLLPLAVMAACSPATSGAASSGATAEKSSAERHPESGLRVIPLTVSSGGKTHSFNVEFAESPEQQAKGLMFRREMGSDEGMIFPFNPPRPASFWMKNTVIPLDIIFIGTDHRILNIEADAAPYSESPRLSRGKAAAVLELNGGRAAELGLGPGDKVTFQLPKRLAPVSASE